MMRRLYILLALLMIGGYGYAGWRGKELARTKKGIAPQGVRGARSGPGIFWYGGYRGGK